MTKKKVEDENTAGSSQEARGEEVRDFIETMRCKCRRIGKLCRKVS